MDLAITLSQSVGTTATSERPVDSSGGSEFSKHFDDNVERLERRQTREPKEADTAPASSKEAVVDDTPNSSAVAVEEKTNTSPDNAPQDKLAKAPADLPVTAVDVLPYALESEPLVFKESGNFLPPAEKPKGSSFVGVEATLADEIQDLESFDQVVPVLAQAQQSIDRPNPGVVPPNNIMPQLKANVNGLTHGERFLAASASAEADATIESVTLAKTALLDTPGLASKALLNPLNTSRVLSGSDSGLVLNNQEFLSSLNGLQQSLGARSLEGGGEKPMLSLETPMSHSRWGQDFNQRVQWVVKQSMSGAQIRLNPQHMGPVEVRVQVNNDQTTISFTAQHGATREAIDAALPRLRDMLSQQDVNVVDVNVSQHSFAEQREQQAANGDANSEGIMTDEETAESLFEQEGQTKPVYNGLFSGIA